MGVKVAQVAVGGWHTVICSDESRVWTFVFDKDCQLGHCDVSVYEWAPRIVEGLFGVKVTQVAAGDCHTVICSAEGHVRSLGWVGDSEDESGESHDSEDSYVSADGG